MPLNIDLDYLDEVISDEERLGELAQLLAQGLDPNTFIEGISILQTLSNWGHLEMVKLLIAYGANVNISEEAGIKTPLKSAICSKEFGKVLESGSKEYPPHPAIVKVLCEAGANVNFVCLGKKWSLLHNAVMIGEDEKTTEIEPKVSPVRDIVQALLDYGANVNAVDNVECTPLYSAVAIGRLDLVKLLLKYGATMIPAKIVSRDQTRMHYASPSERAHDRFKEAVKKGDKVAQNKFRMMESVLAKYELLQSIEAEARIQDPGRINKTLWEDLVNYRQHPETMSQEAIATFAKPKKYVSVRMQIFKEATEMTTKCQTEQELENVQQQLVGIKITQKEVDQLVLKSEREKKFIYTQGNERLQICYETMQQDWNTAYNAWQAMSISLKPGGASKAEKTASGFKIAGEVVSLGGIIAPLRTVFNAGVLGAKLYDMYERKQDKKDAITLMGKLLEPGIGETLSRGLTLYQPYMVYLNQLQTRDQVQYFGKQLLSCSFDVIEQNFSKYSAYHFADQVLCDVTQNYPVMTVVKHAIPEKTIMTLRVQQAAEQITKQQLDTKEYDMKNSSSPDEKKGFLSKLFGGSKSPRKTSDTKLPPDLREKAMPAISSFSPGLLVSSNKQPPVIPPRPANIPYITPCPM